MQNKIYKRKQIAKAAAFAILVSLAGTNLVCAENGIQSNFTLDPIIITAQRSETRDLDTPATVNVIDENILKSSGARTVFDALAFTQGITNFSYGPGGQDYGAMDSRVVIRGFDRGALVLVNGAPINLLNKNSLDSIPLESVERIEVVKGASSTLYGAEAFGGVINIITKKGGSEKTTVTASAGNLGYRKYAANYTNEDIIFFYGKQKFGAMHRTSPDRPTLPSDTKVRNYYQNRGAGDKESISLSLNLDDKWNISYLRSESNNTYGTTPYWDSVTDSTNTSATKNNVSYRYNDVKDSLNILYDDKNNNFKTVAFYNSRNLYGQTLNNYAHTTTVNSSNYKVYNIGLDTQKSWKTRDERDKILAGIVVSTENYKNASNSVQQAERDNIALYGQYAYKISPNFSTILGARGQVINDPLKDQKVFIPQIQTIYKINTNSSWYTNFGKAFQMPQINQYFSKTVNNRDDLKPQEGWNYEAGYKIIDSKNSWKFAVYKMDFNNKFDWTKDDENKDVLINIGKFKNTGFEIEYNKSINDSWKTNVGFNYGNPKAEDGKGGWQQTYPKLQLSAGVQYEMDKWMSSLTCNYLTKRQNNQYGEKIPSTINVNAVVNYNMGTNDTITLNFNNILDKKNVITHGGYDYWDLPFNWTLSWARSF